MKQNVIWIVTIGSSDVQLKTDKFWHPWCSEIEHEFRGCHFEPVKVWQRSWGNKIQEFEEATYRLPARVLGLLYNVLPDQVSKHLTFPLLRVFAQQLKEQEKVTPTTIIVLLTNQEQFFSQEDKDKDFCPYWQDTVLLKQALLDCFFEQEFSGISCEWIILSPEDEQAGLDHWDAVLQIVTEQLQKKMKDAGIELKLGDKVYVSHQAGTPAISSAVQFACLAEFEKQFQPEEKQTKQTVNFLVANEYGSLAKPIKSSEYLKGIRKQEAKTLLARHDYSGVEALVRDYLKDDENTRTLLNAAIQWNFAEFKNFVEKLDKHQAYKEIVRKHTMENWWWTAYEAAYLALVRLRQGNTVEAVFHSFRAVEGLLRNYVDEYYLAKPVQKDLRKYIHSKDGSLIKRSNGKNFQAFGKDLYWFIKQEKFTPKNQKMCKHITIFGEQVFDRRNELFHQLKGLYQLEKLPIEIKLEELKEIVYRFWEIDSNSERDWMNRIIGCLNFISNQNYEFLDFEHEENSCKEASLMVKVHRELKKSLANL
ncbi:MAG: hypothetical protein IGS54_16945 [Elainella sp. C42_A2020_010]|nr:hypothetical protein [Elainella sp. C42_A2020_010]